MMPPNTDGSGRGPVSIVRQSTTITSGVAVTQKLVDASIAFGNILRRTYGPNGLDKMNISKISDDKTNKEDELKKDKN